MTFTIGGTDFSSYITKYGYATAYTPIYFDSVTTMDGVEHVAVIRYGGALTVQLRPLTALQWATLKGKLTDGILTVKYTCLQRNQDVTASMKLDTMSAELVLQNASRSLYGNAELAFNEL